MKLQIHLINQERVVSMYRISEKKTKRIEKNIKENTGNTKNDKERTAKYSIHGCVAANSKSVQTSTTNTAEINSILTHGPDRTSSLKR